MAVANRLGARYSVESRDCGTLLLIRLQGVNRFVLRKGVGGRQQRHASKVLFVPPYSACRMRVAGRQVRCAGSDVMRSVGYY